MTFLNLTPHVITAQTTDGKIIEIPASGVLARIATKAGPKRATHQGIDVYEYTEFGEIVGLPAYDPNSTTVFIVPTMILERCKGRPDVVAPGTGPHDFAVRYDEGPQKGQIMYVTRFVSAPRL